MSGKNGSYFRIHQYDAPSEAERGKITKESARAARKQAGNARTHRQRFRELSSDERFD